MKITKILLLASFAVYSSTILALPSLQLGAGNTGDWDAKAIKEAKVYGEGVEEASSKDDTFNYIPIGLSVPEEDDYFHVTTNNTNYGTEVFEHFDCKVPVAADMSSNIFSNPIDVSKYALIYGGAQKNLAPAGVTFIIIRNDILGKVSEKAYEFGDRLNIIGIGE